MAALGQGGTAPPPAGAPAPAPATPAPAAAPGQDRFGFGTHVAQAPEHLRPMLQTAFDQISPQLTQQLERFAPVEPHLERLGPLLQPDDTGATPLEGLATLYELFTDPEKADDLADWWEAVGDELGFFDDDEPGGAGGGTDPAGAAAAPVDLNAIEDPAMRAVVAQLMQNNEQLTAQLGEFKDSLQQSSQQQQINSTAERLANDLKTRMKTAGIEGHEDLNSPNAIDIMRIATSYGEDPQAIEKATADFARLTGRTPAAPVNPALDGAAALQAALNGGIAPAPARPAPGPSLGRGNADTEPEAVKGWDQARELALQRLRESETAG